MSNEQPWSPQNHPGPPPYGYPGGPGYSGPQPPMGPPPMPPLAEWWERFVARLIDGAVFMAANMTLSSILFAVFVPLSQTASRSSPTSACTRPCTTASRGRS